MTVQSTSNTQNFSSLVYTPSYGRPANAFREVLLKIPTNDSSGSSSEASASETEKTAPELLPALYGIKPKNGCITMEDMESKAKELEAEFGKRVRTALQKAGIPTNQAVDISYGFDKNPSGEWNIQGDNPHKDEIRKVLETTPGLYEYFSMVTSLRETIQAGKEAMEFQAAYRKDPIEAVRRFAYLFDQNRPTQFYHFLMDQEGTSHKFTLS